MISSTTIKPATNILQQVNQSKLLQATKTATKPPALVTISSSTNMPSLAVLSNTPNTQQQSETIQIPQQIGATKIVQIKTGNKLLSLLMLLLCSLSLYRERNIFSIKILLFFYYTAPTIRTTVQNIPPLIPTQQPTILNIQQNVVNRQPVVSLQSNTSTPTSISYITTNQSSVNQTNWRTNQTDDKQQIANATFQNVQQQQTTQVNLMSQSFKK